jgi:chromosome segregation ATPase
MAEPNFSDASNSQFDESFSELREILLNQLHDLQQLTDIADAVKKEQQISERVEFLKANNEQISRVSKQQQERFGTIDRLMSEHVLAVKKGRASNEDIVVLAKEIRKTEAGIRTVKLFLCDVMNMLNPDLNLVNRIDDRIQYCYKRSSELENEIAILQAKIN